MPLSPELQEQYDKSKEVLNRAERIHQQALNDVLYQAQYFSTIQASEAAAQELEKAVLILDAAQHAFDIVMSDPEIQLQKYSKQQKKQQLKS